jgi:5-methylcytosine-specific restriction endonuclease McrA
MAILTVDILNEGKSRNGFWSNKQLYALGIREIKKGWKKLIIGKEVPDECIRNFLELKDKHLESSNSRPNSSSFNFDNNDSKNKVFLTEELLERGKSRNGSWSAEQLKTLGVLEIRKGWKRNIIGREFSEDIINRFLKLKNKHLDEGSFGSSREKSYDRLGVVNQDIPIKEQYQNLNWIELKKIVLERDGYMCKICKIKYVELHVHHMVYPKGKFIWEIEPRYLVTICKNCHEKVHDKELNVV